ncbi:MAG: hypothetical protein UU16_C0057G0006 [Candidatus Woesebacteria bacterium GW2011_GWA2_40_7]|uniref:DUF4177 domain-containing protein n=3 Tax=Candidatus Woeseibacteriota TaxID=1752722 RepID=A0A0G0XWQ1_9BACT|nr:MAG: hypothetical protein UT17_C0001G0141 [Candidatus Woesebacteria bacterium GW2011_GWB1_39_10]KKR71640.1 MAG: hypothetical protein UU16_C0057G0006 [Candidatus Woesebacteria bacterium GW2011_GWA2_40_7]KKR92327.1 MAG: hypothetical protein UU42_C0002G0141 [Candidatus Woesebacteria bacterium GW2011_GWA1_41_13b]
MRKYDYLEVWGGSEPDRPLVVSEVGGEPVTGKWGYFLEQKGKEGWELVSCSVFPNDTFGILGWLRFYAVFKRTLSESNRHNV